MQPAHELQTRPLLSSWLASFSSLPRPVSFGQTFPLPLCHLFVVPSLHAWLGAVPTVAQLLPIGGGATRVISLCCATPLAGCLLKDEVVKPHIAAQEACLVDGS